MSTPTNLLDEVLDSWYEVRKGLIREIQNIPPARFTFRPTLETRNVTELVQHVLEVANLLITFLPGLSRYQVMHSYNQHIFVMTAIKYYNFAFSGSLLMDTP